MFTKLHLRNFKAWKDTGDVVLAPVTILLGTNSSGKSSLLQSLLLLKQTVQSPDRSIHLDLGGDEVNDYFNFGYFDDVLCKDASPRQFEIALSFSSASGKVKSGFYKAVYVKTAAGAAAVSDMTMEGEGKKFRIVRRERGSYSINLDDEPQARDRARIYEPERSIALSAEAIKSLKEDGSVFEDISLALRRELENISYLGPLRRKPERDYAWNKTKPGEIGGDGSKVADAILASALLRGKQNGDPVIVERISYWLEKMGVADKLDIRQLGHSTRYEIIVFKDGIEANLRDVGIGVSQVLPVLTLAYFAPAGATVILEEPEIPLHPLAQSVLAELLLEVSATRSIQFIVETHSEHLFRRMQTVVARGDSKPEQCALYFVERDGAQASLRKLTLDEFGRVGEWPDKFFGDALGETREQARLFFERQSKDKDQTR